MEKIFPPGEIESNRFRIRFYAGSKGEESPRSVIIDEIDYPVKKVISRQRVLDRQTNVKAEVFLCQLEEAVVIIKLFDTGKKTLWIK